MSCLLKLTDVRPETKPETNEKKRERLGHHPIIVMRRLKMDFSSSFTYTKDSIQKEVLPKQKNWLTN